LRQSQFREKVDKAISVESCLKAGHAITQGYRLISSFD
jgi:hypothetical protein